MARFTQSSTGDGSGIPGPQGPQGNPGADGADALWNFVGEYNNGADYNIGDVVTYAGGTYYRVGEPNPGYPPGTVYWTTVAAPGAEGDQGPQGEPGDLDTGTTTINNYSPTWSGTGLSFTGTPATGSYIKIGNLVMIQIDVLFTNVSDFGTGQYSLTLPFASKYHTDVYGGSIHDVGGTTDHYSIKGHLSPSSSSMTIWSLKSSAQDEPFDNNSPFILTTSDKFHMSFSYICE
jgi:hypothetical protein